MMTTPHSAETDESLAYPERAFIFCTNTRELETVASTKCFLCFGFYQLPFSLHCFDSDSGEPGAPYPFDAEGPR